MKIRTLSVLFAGALALGGGLDAPLLPDIEPGEDLVVGVARLRDGLADAALALRVGREERIDAPRDLVLE